MRPNNEFQLVTALTYHTSVWDGTKIYSNSYYRSYERTWTGTRTTNYRSRKSRREFIPPLAYSSNVIRRSIPLTLLATSSTGYPADPTFALKLWLLDSGGAGEPPLSLVSGEFLNDAKNKALRSLSNKLQNVRANLALMFVERRQTASLIADTAFRVATAARSLRRADLRGFTRALSLGVGDRARVARGWHKVAATPVDKRLANHWLEYVFGWLPLLNDIRDAAELLAESVATYKEPKGFLRARGATTGTYTFRDPLTGSGHIYADKDVMASFTARINAWYELESEARSILSKTGISNPASLAWEALPFSFVVDWFLPVGNYLDSLTAFDGFTFKSATYSTLENAVAEWRLGVYNQPGYPYGRMGIIGAPGTAKATQSRYTRVVGIPSYSFPSIRSPIGNAPLQRFATAAALLTQLFR